MMRNKLFTVFLAISIYSLFGCGSARRAEPIAGPLELKTQELLLGQKVFTIRCDQCHPGGEAGLGPSLNNKPLPGFLMKLQVRRGLGVMPGFPEEQVSGEELEALIAYIKTLRHHK